ncbi:MAG: sirohydrochlorin cobaltochelatase [Oleispira sp.]|jgi:sirohydrochlorin cobaltochelatase
MNDKTANILLAHGSRDPKWQIPFKDMTHAIKQQDVASLSDPSQDIVVELAFMELCEPSLEQMCEQLSQQGFNLINIYPVFFAAGIHLRVDVPKQLEAIEAELGLRTKLHPPVGQEKEVQEAITQVILARL